MGKTGLLPVEPKQELWVSHDGSRSFRRARVTDGNGPTIWQAIESNAKGQLTITQSGGKETTFGFNNKGFPPCSP